jgi:hypothetical protein
MDVYLLAPVRQLTWVSWHDHLHIVVAVLVTQLVLLEEEQSPVIISQIDSWHSHLILIISLEDHCAVEPLN